MQKLAYLKSFLLGPAAESVQGYTLTKDYYSLVVEFLKKRFGRKRLIIQAHMDEIIDLSKFDTTENYEMRSFLDTLKSNLRSVVPLGVQTELLAPLLIPLLMRKMPKKVIEKFKFKIKNVETDGPLVPMVGLVPIQKGVIPIVLLVNMHLTRGT